MVVQQFCDPAFPATRDEPRLYDVNYADSTRPATCAMVNPFGHTSNDVTYRNNVLDDDGQPHPVHTFASLFRIQSATHSRPQQWVQHTNCTVGTSFQTVRPTMTTDRVCTAVSPPCNAANDLFEVVAPTYTTDRVCTTCGAGNFTVLTPTARCVPCTDCAEADALTTTACSGTQDSQCQNCTSGCRQLVPGATADVVFIMDDSLSIPLLSADAISDSTFQFQEAARRLANRGILNRVAVARTSTQLPRLVVSIDGSTPSGTPPVAGNASAVVDVVARAMAQIRASARTEGTLGDTLTAVAADLEQNAAGRRTFTDGTGARVGTPLVIVYFGDGMFSEGGAVRETQQQGVATAALARISAAYGCSRAAAGQLLTGNGCGRVKLLLFSLAALTADGLTALITEAQVERGVTSTFHIPFEPLRHVDRFIESAFSTFNGSGAVTGQDFGLCAIHGCPAGSFMVSDCGGTDGATDRQCREYATCAAGEFEALPGNATHDRVCRPISFCAETLFQLAPPTATTDRQCAEHRQCVDLGRPCPRTGNPLELRSEGCGDDPLDEFEIAAPTLTSDIVCQRYQQCNFSEHETLGSSEFVDELPTWSSDRTCGTCNISCTTEVADVVFMIDSTGSIEEPIFGGSPGNFQRMIDFARRIVGDPQLFGGAQPDETVFRLPHCAMSDSQALQGSLGSKFASIVWSDDAIIDFDFNEYAYDMARLGQDGLQNTPFFGNQTFTNFAYNRLTELLFSTRRHTSGFRYFNVPVVVIMLSDGVSSNQSSMLEAVRRFRRAANAFNETAFSANASQSGFASPRFSMYPIALAREGRILREEFDLVAAEGLLMRTQTIYEVADSLNFADLQLTALRDAMQRDLRVCGQLCPAGTFRSRQCGAVENRRQFQIQCLPWRRCNASTDFILSHPTPTSDRVCASLSECDFSREFAASEPQECHRLTEPCPGESSVEVTFCSDRVCQSLSLCEEGFTFEASAPTQSSDRVCQPVRQCTGELFSVTEPTITSDRTCEDCNRICASNEFEEAPCTPTTNRVCTRIAQPCNALTEFEAQSPNATRNRICAPVSLCDASQFEDETPTPSSDRECLNTTVCDGISQFESSTPTLTSDRVCTNFSVCSPTQFASFSGNGTSDRVCEDLTACFPRFEFESVAATVTSDRECSALSSCTLPATFEATPPTSTSDRECQQVRFCDPAFQFEEVGATPTSNTVCGVISPCPSGQFVAQNATSSSNTQCAHCSRCPGRHASAYFVIDCRNGTFDGPCFDQLRLVSHYVAQNPVGTGSLQVGVVSYDSSGAHLLVPLGSSPSSSIAAYLNGTLALPSPFSLVGNGPAAPVADALTLVRALVAQDATREAHVLVYTGNSLVSSAGREAIINSSSLLSSSANVHLYVQFFGSALFHPAIADYWDEVVSDPSAIFTPISDPRQLLSLVLQISDVVCPPACPENTFQTAPCSIFSDRVCSSARECIFGLEFESAVPTLLNDRICTPLTSCEVDEFESVEPTLTSDRTCSPVTDCSGNEFVAARATLRSNTVCETISLCNSSQFEVSAPTTSSDRTCRAATVCNFPSQFAASAATATTDTECATSRPPCNSAIEFEARPLLPSANRVCQAIASCETAQFEVQAPSSTTNRVCNGCQRCYGDGLHFIFVLSQSPSLVDLVQGGSPGAFEFLRDAIRSTVRQAPRSASVESKFSVVLYGGPASAASVVELASVENSSSLSAIDLLVTPSVSLGGSSDIRPALVITEAIIFNQLAGSTDGEGSGDGVLYGPDRTVVVFLTDGILRTDPPAFVGALSQLRSRRVMAVGSAHRAQDSQAQRRLALLSSSGQITSAASVNGTFLGAARALLQGLCTVCPDGSFQQSPCGPNTDRVCAPLSAPCATGVEFERIPPSDVRDRQCTPTTNCSNLEFVQQESTQTSDRRCSTLTTCDEFAEFIAQSATLSSDRDCGTNVVCGPVGVEFEQLAPTTTSGRQCAVVSEPCPPGTFERHPPTPTSDRDCRRVTNCFNQTLFDTDQFIHAPSTPTSDAICRSIQQCDFQTEHILADPTASSDRSCATLTSCNASEFEFVAPTASTDRQCQQVSVCRSSNGTADFDFERSGPSATTDRVCIAVRPPCSSTEFEAQRPTASTDRQCIPYSVSCSELQFESTPRTATADRACTRRTVCGSGTYTVHGGLDQDNTCPSCDVCRGLPVEFESQPCASGLNRLCSPVSVCDVFSEFMSHEATATTDRVCNVATVCAEDETEWIPLRADEDRVCGVGPRPSCDCTPGGQLSQDGAVIEGSGTQWEVFGSNTVYQLPTCNARRQVPSGHFEPVSARIAPGFCFNDTVFRPCSTPLSCVGLPMDVVILLDESNSIDLPQYGGRPGRFNQMKAAALALVSQFDISVDGTHVALVTYGDRPQIQFSFNRFSSDLNTLATAIANIDYNASGGTRHDLALAEVRQILLDPIEGAQLDRGRRANAPTLLVFVTDSGRTDADPFQDALEQQLDLLDERIDRFVITAGNPNAIAVQTIAHYNGTTSQQPAGSVSRVLVAGNNFSAPVTEAIVAHVCHACPAGSFLATTCSPTTDNTCGPHSAPCDNPSRVGELFEARSPTVTTDRECRNTTRCATRNAIEFEISRPTFTTDRRCGVVNICDFDSEFIRVDATVTSQRECTSHRTCASNVEFEHVAPTSTTDRQCTPYIAECSGQEFEVLPRSPTTDRSCSTFRPPCGPHEDEVAPPTPTSDRQCQLVSIAGYTERDGFVSNWHLHRVRTAVQQSAVVLTNATLRECANACTAAPECASFSRQALPVADCILGGPENRCGGTVLPRPQWHVWHRTDDCPACTTALGTSLAQRPPFSTRMGRAGGYDIVTEPSIVWSVAERRTCASQTFLNRIDGVSLTACQDECNATADCYAVWFIPPSTVVTTSRCVLFSEAQCSFLIGAFRGGDLHFRPLPNETCTSSSCPSNAVECYGSSSCVSDMCVRPPLATQGTRCFDFNDAAFDLAECHFGQCTPRCPDSTLPTLLPLEANSTIELGDVAIQWCAEHTECGCDEYEVSGPTTSVDRMCVKATAPCLSIAPANSAFEVTALTPTSDRQCTAATSCDGVGIEYESILLTATTDRHCAPVTQCHLVDGLFEHIAPTATSDAVCATVSSCIPEGETGEQFQRFPPTPTTDRHCSNLTTCSESEYALVVATLTSDRVCSALTTCPVGSFGIFTGVLGETDRTCTECTRYCSGQMEGDLVFIVDQSGAVEYPWHGGAEGNFATEIGFFERIVTAVRPSEVSQDGLRVAIVSYSSTASVDLDLADQVTRDVVVSRLRGLTYAGLGFNVSAALQAARHQFIARSGVPQAVVLVVSNSAGIAADNNLAAEVAAWEALARDGDLAVHVVLVDDDVANGFSQPPAEIQRLVSMNRPAGQLVADSTLTIVEEFSNLTALLDVDSFFGSVCTVGCPTGTFQSSNCSRDTDMICAATSPPCAGNEFEVHPPSTFSDRVCASRTTCGSNQYISSPATPSSNVVCVARTLECAVGTFTSSEGTATSDRTCSPQVGPCDFPLEFESASPTSTSARVCSTPTTCGAVNVEWMRSDVSPTTDRDCANVSACSNEHFMVSAATPTSDVVCQVCLPLFVCASTQYATPCAGTQNRRCLDSTVCTSSQFAVVAATHTSDRVCASLSPPCSAGQYEAAHPIPTEDRVCRNVSGCGTDQYAQSTATASSDAVCRDVTSCSFPTTFETRAPTSSTDRVCSAVRRCLLAIEFESVRPTFSTDRTCQALTPCVNEAFISANATLTTDRICGASAACDLTANFLLQPLGFDASNRCLLPGLMPVCTPVSPPCNASSFQAAAPSISSDRVCIPLTICSDLNEVELAAPTPTTDRVCGSTPAALDFFSSAVALTAVSDERLASHAQIRTPQQCATLCLAAVGCGSFAWSSQYSFCLLFEEALPNNGDGQEHDLLYFERLANGPTVRQVSTTTAAAVTTVTAQSDSLSLDGFHPPVNGTAAQFGRLYECIRTLEHCLDLCRSTPACVAAEYSGAGEVCAVMTSYAMVPPMLHGDFRHFARDVATVSPSQEILHVVDLFGSALSAAVLGAPAILLDGTPGAFASMPTSRITAGNVHADVSFRQRSIDGRFGYLFCKSDVAGRTRSFAVGIKTSGLVSEVWLFYLTSGQSEHTLEKFNAPNGTVFTDGAVHNITVAITGYLRVVRVDSHIVATGVLQSAAPIVDVAAESVFNIGQRAPGRFAFSGAIIGLAINGFGRTRNAVVSPAVSIGHVFHRDSRGVVGAGLGMPSVSTTFSVAVSAVLHVGTRGYLFARTNGRGTVRYYGVYVPAVGRVRLYYRTAGSTRNRVAFFRINVNDGRAHRVLLSISGVVARLHVDDHIATASLAGHIVDCSDSDCVFHIGQRANGFNRVLWAIEGMVAGVTMHPTAAHADFPRHGSFSAVDLLTTDGRMLVGTAAAVPRGQLQLDGTGHAVVHVAEDAFGGDATFTFLSVTYIQRDAGYLIARADSSGTRRWLAVYSGDTSITVYFRSGGIQQSTRFGHSIEYDSSTPHSVLVTSTGSPPLFVVTLDGVVLGNLTVPNGLDTCGAECATWVGRRPPANFGFRGTIQHAVVHTIF